MHKGKGFGLTTKHVKIQNLKVVRKIKYGIHTNLPVDKGSLFQLN
jgi:hypothetical protein